MYSDDELNSAVKAGVFSKELADAFRAHVAQLRQSPHADEESFRLVTGFNDIFVVVACTLLLASLAWLGLMWEPWAGTLAVSVAAWMLAEYFTRQRHMALPSIMLLLAFILSSALFGAIMAPEPEWRAIAGGLFGAAAACGHWLRFKVPITVAAGVGAAAASVVAYLLISFPKALEWTSFIFLVSGLAVFALAMYWDIGDRQRSTYRSDVAFWLHLLASPLIVHSTFSFLGVVTEGDVATSDALVVFVLYLLLALVSLAIDRRALMVSALAYVLYTFSAMFEMYGAVGKGFAITALIVGSVLLLLSAFWQGTRALLIKRLPQSWQSYLPETSKRMMP